jgi:phage-related protein
MLPGDTSRVLAADVAARRELGDALCATHAGIGPRCRELRINDEGHTWRIICRVDSDAIVIVEVFDKKTRATPKVVIETCKDRLRRYDAV